MTSADAGIFSMSHRVTNPRQAFPGWCAGVTLRSGPWGTVDSGHGGAETEGGSDARCSTTRGRARLGETCGRRALRGTTGEPGVPPAEGWGDGDRLDAGRGG